MTDAPWPSDTRRDYQPSARLQAAKANAFRRRDARYLFTLRALAVLLAGYLLFDRAFAWIHVPGTPLFVGEMVLVLGLYTAWRSREVIRFIRLSPPIQLLVVFMVFGALLTVLGLREHDFQDTVRDAAIWYYGLFAIVIGTLAIAFRPTYQLLLKWYTTIIPAFIVIGFIRALNANRAIAVFVPDSDVSITSHKPGNLGVQAVILVAFLLLVQAPTLERREQVRNVVLTVGGLSLLAVAGTQNRGVLVAGFLALLLIYFSGRAARPILGKVVAVMIGGMVLASAFNLSIELERRELSVSQLFNNLVSLNVSPDGSGQTADDGTIAWRLRLWDLVVDDTLTRERFLSGFGFGPNLAGRYGFVAGPDIGPELRNPHNSHLSVAARMGLVGTGLWLALWVVWYRTLWKARKRFLFAGEEQKAGFLAWCMIGALAALINGIFDPSLEGPQAAVWVWSLFGLGAFVAIEGTVARWRQRTTAWARQAV